MTQTSIPFSDSTTTAYSTHILSRFSIDNSYSGSESSVICRSIKPLPNCRLSSVTITIGRNGIANSTVMHSSLFGHVSGHFWTVKNTISSVLEWNLLSQNNTASLTELTCNHKATNCSLWCNYLWQMPDSRECDSSLRCRFADLLSSSARDEWIEGSPLGPSAQGLDPGLLLWRFLWIIWLISIFANTKTKHNYSPYGE